VAAAWAAFVRGASEVAEWQPWLGQLAGQQQAGQIVGLADSAPSDWGC